eukprot:413072-Amphidinium_carterae.1
MLKDYEAANQAHVTSSLQANSQTLACLLPAGGARDVLHGTMLEDASWSHGQGASVGWGMNLREALLDEQLPERKAMRYRQRSMERSLA